MKRRSFCSGLPFYSSQVYVATAPGLKGIIDHGFEHQSVADTGWTSEAEHVHSSERRIVATQTTRKTKHIYKMKNTYISPSKELHYP